MRQPALQEFERLDERRVRHGPTGFEFARDQSGDVEPFGEHGTEGEYDLDDLIDMARVILNREPQ